MPGLPSFRCGNLVDRSVCDEGVCPWRVSDHPKLIKAGTQLRVSGEQGTCGRQVSRRGRVAPGSRGGIGTKVHDEVEVFAIL